MADPTNQESQSPLATIRDLGNLGVERAKQLPEEFKTARALIDQAMQKLQNPGHTVNAPLLAASLAMFKPTRAGGFGESLAHAGDAGIPALLQQRDREMNRNAQLAQLAKERGAMGVQEANALMAFPGQQAGLESALADLRFYEMMRTGQTPSGVPAGVPGKAGVAGASLAPQAGAPTVEGGAPAVPPGAPTVQGGPTPVGRVAAQPGWLQELPAEMRGRVGQLARIIEIGMSSGSKAGLERAANAQQLLQQITGPGWMYDPARGGWLAVGEKDPGYIGKIEGIKNWAKVAPEAALHSMKKQIDSGYEFVEYVDENGQKQRVTVDQARQALGYGVPGASRAPGATAPAPGAASAPPSSPGATPTPPGAPPSAPGRPSGLPSSDMPVTEAQTKPVAEFGIDLRNVYTANQKLIPRLERTYDILRDLESGMFAEKKAEIAAALRSIGINVPNSATMNPEAVQKLLKEQIQSVFEQIKGVTSRPALQEFIMLQQANANPELQPGANAAILRQALGLLDYENNVYKDWVDWRGKNPGTREIDPFILDYTQRHKVDRYIDDRGRRLGNLRGEPLPPKDQLNPGTQYVLPDGRRAKWDGEAFIPVTGK
jgi:hypothetical protein